LTRDAARGAPPNFFETHIFVAPCAPFDVDPCRVAADEKRRPNA
jgi:hypothetical protein